MQKLLLCAVLVQFAKTSAACVENIAVNNGDVSYVQSNETGEIAAQLTCHHNYKPQNQALSVAQCKNGTWSKLSACQHFCLLHPKPTILLRHDKDPDVCYVFEPKTMHWKQAKRVCNDFKHGTLADLRKNARSGVGLVKDMIKKYWRFVCVWVKSHQRGKCACFTGAKFKGTPRDRIKYIRCNDPDKRRTICQYVAV